MKVSLSLDSSYSEDVAVVVDVLRASSTITVATQNFDKIIPVKSIDDAKYLAKKYDAVLAGERRGAAITGFDTGNSPLEISNFHGNVLVITTSNGTRIMEGIKAKILIGSFVNAKAVAKEALKQASSHIEVVMAGVEGRFAIEDYLGAGEIISYLKGYELEESALGAYMASLNEELVNNAVKNSRSARKLGELGLSEDVNFCLKRNLYDHVPVYANGSITGVQ
ncbi:MAG: 2-phosphosulfolactate phosphatase [Methanobacterium sp.]|nr:2-phosphosulfolactate phosphatase [Methanobacterium sp.]